MLRRYRSNPSHLFVCLCFQSSGRSGSFKNSMYQPQRFCSFDKEQDLRVLYQNEPRRGLYYVVQCGEMSEDLGPRSARLSQKFVATVAEREPCLDSRVPSLPALHS